jgi:predicted permease
MKLFRRLNYWLRVRRNQADLAEEMEIHREMGGAMGNTTRAREDARAVWIWPWLESVMQDVRYALRNLRAQPGFAALAILALGCAIGLNTSLFTVFNAIAIRPWPVEDPGRVVNILQLSDRRDTHGFSLEEARYFGAHSKTISGILAMRSGQNVRVEDGKAVSSWVSGSYFNVLGVGMQQGRGFRADEDRLDAPQPVVVVAYAYWRNRMGAEPNVIGRKIRIEDTPFTVVGVTGSDFSGTDPQAVDLYVPMSAATILQPHAAWMKNFLLSPDYCCTNTAGRLAPGVSRAQAQAELTVLHQQFRSQLHEESYGVVLRGTAFLGGGGRDDQKILPIFILMFLGMSLVLLLACANVGNLLLARAAARQREISVRLSLGASRRRVIRQLLTESLVLACMAGVLGVAAAYRLPLLVFHYAVNEPLSLQLVPDSMVLIYALLLSAATCLVFGLAPALHGTRPGGIRSSFSLRSVLLTAQVALSVVLLVGAGLMTRGVRRARTQDPGFTISGVSIAQFDLPANSYDAPRARAFFAQLSRDLAGKTIGLTRLAPLGNSRNFTSFKLPGEAEKQGTLVAVQEVNSGYFAVLGIPVLKGRTMEDADADRSVVLINQTLARRFFDGNALGKSILTGKPVQPREIVGIVKDAFTTGLDEVSPTIYFPLGGDSIPVALFHTTPGAADAIAAVAKEIDPRAGTSFTPLSVNLDKYLQASRAGAAIAEGLGAFALALATIGIFGVFAYWVEQRTKEIGIRMALGARPRQVIRLVLSSSSRAVFIGLVLGFAGAAAASRLLQRLLFGLSPFDPISYAMVALVLAAAGLAATFFPVRRATRIDPMTALRCD